MRFVNFATRFGSELVFDDVLILSWLANFFLGEDVSLSGGRSFSCSEIDPAEHYPQNWENVKHGRLTTSNELNAGAIDVFLTQKRSKYLFVGGHSRFLSLGAAIIVWFMFPLRLLIVLISFPVLTAIVSSRFASPLWPSFWTFSSLLGSKMRQ